MTQTYHANGKLLLTGEYFILDGAVGLALPTKFGQSLSVEASAEKGIFWKSIDHENKVWLEVQFSESLEIISTSNNGIAETLQNILLKSQISNLKSQITTILDFPNDWGLGSSSTLISLLAQYAIIDPYELLAKTFGGSGYDIACATANSAITYQLRTHDSGLTTAIDFNPTFKEHLYFVHLNQKQNSREGIQHYKNLTIDKTEYIEQISEITQKLIHANELDEFCYYLEVHENIVGNVLNLRKVKEIYFSDFPGTVKSLGAWGGDFILVASDESPEMITRYFQQKGFSTILSYKDMIL
ncbi:MAG TPA: GYDIA family GHMP kinase [Chitinophagales bacterium]|nr:GYDIA family GHMP kinase [Chitinophagales bacterium]